jgi:hypothetical protein
MYRNSAIIVALLGTALGVLDLSSQAAQQVSGMITLTDGTKMDNFDRTGNANWRVAERAIAADHGNGFLVTKEPYGDFKLRAEFYSDEGTNSGVFIRCENPQQPSAQSCYEVQINDGNPNRDNATGAIVNVAKVDRVPQTELKWNVIEIEAKGPQLNVSVNGERPGHQARARPHCAAICLRRDLLAQSRNSAAICRGYRSGRRGDSRLLPSRVCHHLSRPTDGKRHSLYDSGWKGISCTGVFRRKGRQPVFRDLNRLRDRAVF